MLRLPAEYGAANLSQQAEEVRAEVSATAVTELGRDGGRSLVADDWLAVGKAITARLEELRMTQLELAAKSKVAPATIRELQYNKLSRRRQPRTLEAVSVALEWPAGYLGDVVAGRKVQPHDGDSGDLVLGALDEIRDQLGEVKVRLAAVEERLAREDVPDADR